MNPLIVAAPNGARRGKADHPDLPVTVAEIAAEARACQQAGAAVLHLHVRDKDGGHSLDAGLYRAAIQAVEHSAPGMLVQITTEAAGRFALKDQIAVVRDVMPKAVSVAWREFAPEQQAQSRAFYAFAAEAQIHVQHILYSPDDIARFVAGLSLLPLQAHSVLLVLGSYGGAAASPADLPAYLAALGGAAHDWMVCAFGPAEHACAQAAIAAGGHARVGFENNLALVSGAVAPDTAALVAQFRGPLATPAQAREFWQIRST